MITIYHNPRCSKSREALALVEQFAAARKLPLEIIDYLKTPPDEAQLKALLLLLGGEIGEMVRSNEEEYGALALAGADTATVLGAITAHPKLLQRPIVVYNGRAVVGRPPERLHGVLQAG